jgi:hypothetical protein
MALRHLNCSRNQITDLSPLQGLPLKALRFSPEFVKGDFDFLRSKETLEQIGNGEKWYDVDAFWRWWDQQRQAGDRGLQAGE